MNNAHVSPPPGPQRTPGLLLGPYYPLHAAHTAGADLWLGGALPKGARRLQLEGRVLTADGTPVPDAHIELWQADPAGRYRHPSAPGHALVVRGFTGYGTTRSDAQGGFVLRSLVPGAYGLGDGARAAHLHLQITCRVDRLVTQLFLPGDKHCRADRWYRALAHPERLLPEVLRDDPNELWLKWTAFIAQP